MSSGIVSLLKVFKQKYGLTLKADAARYLEAELSAQNFDEAGRLEALNHIAETYVRHQGNVLVDRKSLEAVMDVVYKKAAVMDMEQGGDDHESTAPQLAAYLHILDALAVPKLKFRLEDKTFVKASDPRRLLAAGSQKVAMIRDRYDLIRQRLLRHKSFRPPAFNVSDSHKYFQITQIKDLNGRKSTSFLLYGMLTQLHEGKYHLEDADSAIELEFGAQLEKSVGFVTQACLVLVDGEYTKNRTFLVRAIIMPPLESRRESISVFGSANDFFGGPREDDFREIERIERTMVDVSFVMLSDVWLDQPQVLAKLRTLFEGYSNAIVPLLFVMIGNFSSQPFMGNGSTIQSYKESFDTLADLIAQYPAICKSRFLFVPGPQDPWGGNVIPRPPIPKFFLSRIHAKLPNATFTTNPCRIKYCNQEIVIFREDILSQMRRNCIVPPDETKEPNIVRHLVKTLLDQSHLSPLPLSVRPIYWDLDHALRLYPVPHLVVLADKYDSYTEVYEGCHCLNPGSFANLGTFAAWSPATYSADICSL